MMNINSIISLLVLLLSIGLSSLEAQSNEWKVSYVVDGDTFYAIQNDTRKKFRLIGIDTPEVAHHQQLEEPYAEKAKEFLKQLIDHKQVILEYDVQTNDRYGRELVYVYTFDSLFVNEALVGEGLAQLMTFPPNVKHVDLFRARVADARQEKKGMWADDVR